MNQLRTKIIYFLPIICLWFCLMGVPNNIKMFAISSIVIFITYLLTQMFGILPSFIKIKPYFLLYFLWLIKEMYISAFAVICLVWKRKTPTNDALAWIDAEALSDLGKVIYANSITLTPGTITIDIQKNKILVHALENSSISELEKGKMSQEVAKAVC